MTQLLYGAPVAEQLFLKTHQYILDNQVAWYLAIFALRESGLDHPSMVYVRKKIEYAQKLWLSAQVYTDYANLSDVLAQIAVCNHDEMCLGVIVQLPLPADLQEHQTEILNAILPKKDVDCLGGNALLLPATPSAIMAILSFYGYDNYVGKNIAVLGESWLIWKPLAQKLRDLWANVYTFNEFSNQEDMREICRKSDYIMACTGSLHLVDERFLWKDQIIVDAWWGMREGKAAWDVYTEKVIWKVQALTPVPWGVWPVTVASLFWNLVQLQSIW